MSEILVIDASVAIKWFVIEPLSERADALLARLAETPAITLYAPDLLYAECANILWKYVWRYGYSPEDACADLLDLTGLAIQSVPTANLVNEALPIAVTHHVSAYDACYAALARLLDAPPVTADEALARKIPADLVRLQWLGEMEPGFI